MEEIRLVTKKELAQYRYDRVTEILQAMFDDEFRYRAAEFKHVVKAYRVKNRKATQQLLEYMFTSARSYRDITFNIDRYKNCAVCGRLFYDMSGNGRKTVCHYELIRVEDDGTYYSECERKRDNAKGRKHYNGGYSGYISDIKPELYTEQKLLERPPLYYNPVAEEDSDEWFFYQHIMSQSSVSCDMFQDPQDIVCGEMKPTHRLESNHKKKLPIIRDKDTGGKPAFKVDILTGQKTEFQFETAIPTFSENSLKIKLEIDLKPPINR